MRLVYAGQTHVGMRRSHNEDSFYIFPEENLFVVADGMGGHASGEVASQLAVETMANFFRATAEDDEVTWPFKMDKERAYDENRLVTSVKLANLRIYEAAQKEGRLRGMGTTVVGALFTENGLLLCHVGDSRIYRLRGGKLEQLTEDHSLLNEYLRTQKLTHEEIETFQHKNVIVRALGMKPVVEVDTTRVDWRLGDVFLLCSDGLSGLVSDPAMAALIEKNANPNDAASALIQAANEAGGTDNITCVLVRVSE
jgi:PPM family protein phosphatase